MRTNIESDETSERSTDATDEVDGDEMMIGENTAHGSIRGTLRGDWYVRKAEVSRVSMSHSVVRPVQRRWIAKRVI